MILVAALAGHGLGSSIISHTQFVADGRSFTAHQKLARHPDLSSVGVVEGADHQKRIYMAASGTYIGKNFVLTAAHLAVNDFGEEADPRVFRFRVRSGDLLRDFKGIRWHVIDVYKRERAKRAGFTFEQVWGDIAVLEVEGLPSNQGVNPPSYLGRAVNIADTVLYVGYGDRGTNELDPGSAGFGRGAKDRFPTPLAFFQQVVEVQKGCGARTLFDSDSALKLQGQPSAGDSGGGVFVLADGKWKYAGITSGGGGYEGGDLSFPFRRAKGRFVDVNPHYHAIELGLAGDWRQFLGIRLTQKQ